MPRYAALLRAINVGGHVVKMDRLRASFEELGFTNVETLIASGNVVFDARSSNAVSLERRIETKLRESLGYDVATFVRTPAQLAAIAARQPFGGDSLGTIHALYVGFLKSAPSEEARRKIASCRTECDELLAHEREVYWLCRARISESAVSGALLERALDGPATFRNVTTVRKLAAKCAPD